MLLEGWGHAKAHGIQLQVAPDKQIWHNLSVKIKTTTTTKTLTILIITN